jgi:hypothetical protein
MKKLLLSFAFLATFTSASFAQYDVQVVLNSPSPNANATGTANFTISYTVTNLGPNAIPQGDTIIVTVIHSDNNFSLTGTAGSVSLIPLPAALPSGTSISSAAIGANATANLASVSGQVCMFATVGLAAVSNPNGDPDDTNMANNLSCFNSVPASASITESNAIAAIAYPNPTVDMLNVAVEGDEVVSIAIIAMDGKIVSTQSGSVAQVSTLSAGMYIYEARTSSGAVIRNTFAKN